MRSGYPVASSSAATAVMKGNRKRDTNPEIRLRSALHRAGLRFRKDYPVRPDEGRPIRIDIAFPAARVAVFVDGCFWHRCPTHGNMPTANAAYWHPKLERNVQRDHETDDRLRAAGWAVIRVWEHTALDDGIAQIAAAVEHHRALMRRATRAGGRGDE